jgi:hypothetical protein
MAINDLLIYGKDYHLWRNGEYLGTATYTDDEKLGNSFLRAVITKSGKFCHEVYVADRWERVK